mgnify:CR=1 FL=1
MAQRRTKIEVLNEENFQSKIPRLLPTPKR